MAVVPDPQKLLLPDPDYVPTFWSDKFFPAFMTTLGFSAVILSRYAARRPIFSGIQQHFLAGGVGAAIGILGQRQYDAYNAEKNAVYLHYIQLHPEDFPMPERKKVGEIFPKFTPIR